MTDDMLARVAAIAARESAKTEDARTAHPGAAAAFDWASRSGLGRPAWVRDAQTGHEMGRRLPDRRTGPVPPIPGVSR